MEENPNILIFESDPLVSAALKEGLNYLGFDLYRVVTPDEPIALLGALGYDLAILGPSLKTGTCLKCNNKLEIIDPRLPILTSCDDFFLPGGELAWDSTKRFHYLSPALEPDEIAKAIEHALRHKAAREVAPDFPLLTGQSPQIKNIRQKIQKVCDNDFTVLITGETGCGKELTARSIHFHSTRRMKPLVKINCGLLPDELMESEVFGFQRGAFTDAHKDKPGRFEMADGGTLFIDEIGNLSIPLQVKFLQAIEDKGFSRLGSTEDKIIDARVIAVTSSDLHKKVREGTFRKDLFYRINVVNIEVPPLRERKDDILLLVHCFLNKYSLDFKRELLEIPDEVANLFLAYRWPGNVRELENVIRRAVALRDFNFVFKDLKLKKAGHEGEHYSLSDDSPPHLNWHDDKVKKFFNRHDFSLKKISKAYVSQVEQEAILKVLKETQWNRKKAAQLLQISYKTLRNRIHEFNLKP